MDVLIRNVGLKMALKSFPIYMELTKSDMDKEISKKPLEKC